MEPLVADTDTILQPEEALMRESQGSGAPTGCPISREYRRAMIPVTVDPPFQAVGKG